MFELSLSDIEKISREVRAQEITYSHLADELIDHICCDVENQMQKGLSFSEAYRKVKIRMGSRRLKEIQEETLYMVDTKYRNMKNAMKISGITGTVLSGFAVIFKLQHWTGAGVLMTLGSLILALIFMPSALSVLWKETRSRKTIFTYLSAYLTALFFIAGTLFRIQHWPGAAVCLSLAALSGALFFIPALVINRFNNSDDRNKRPAYILGSAGLVFYLAGMLFKIMHWPMATILMVSGVLVLCILAFPLYTWVTWKDSTHISSVFLYMIIGALLVIIPGALINLNLQKSFERGFYVSQEQQQSMFKYLHDNNRLYLTMYHDSTGFPLMQQVSSSTDSLVSLINDLREKMITTTGTAGNNSNDNQTVITGSGSLQAINYYLIDQPFEDYTVRNYLNQGTESRENLDSALSTYRDQMNAVSKGIAINTVLQFPDLNSVLPGSANSDNVISLMSGLHSLEVLKNTIMTFEGELLSGIADNMKSN